MAVDDRLAVVLIDATAVITARLTLVAVSDSCADNDSHEYAEANDDGPAKAITHAAPPPARS